MRKFIDAAVSLFESAPRTLYHGTLIEYLPTIQQHGLNPEVGDFVANFYDRSYDEDGYEIEPLEPLVFAAQKRDIQRCVAAIGFRLREKRIDPTPENIIKYGAIIAVKEDESFYQRSSDDYDEHPVQVEPGDFYSMETQIPHYVATGKKLRDLLRRERIEGFYSVKPLSEKIVHRDTIRLNPGDWLDTVIATNPTKSEFYSDNFCKEQDGSTGTPSAAGVLLKDGTIVIGTGHALSHEDICNYSGLNIDDERFRLQIYNNKIDVELWLDEDIADSSFTTEQKIAACEEQFGMTIAEIKKTVGNKTARFAPGWPVYCLLWTDYSESERV